MSSPQEASPPRWLAAGSRQGGRRGNPPRQSTAVEVLGPHPFIGNGIFDRDPGDPDRRESCARCPLDDSRTDVHTMPDVPDHVTEAEARRQGERRETP